MMYKVHYVHKISPSDKDVGPDIALTSPDIKNKNRLAKALREYKILQRGERLREFRVEDGKIVAFPAKSIWHAIILTEDRSWNDNPQPWAKVFG